MVSQTEVLNAMRSAGHPVNTSDIANIIGPQLGRERPSLVAEIAARCSALRKKELIVRCEGNRWRVRE